MKQMRIVLATLIALAMAVPAMAINVEWHGDLNNRFSFSTQADTSVRTSKDSEKYLGSNGFLFSKGKITLPDTKKSKNDSDFFGEIKYRMHMVVSDDEKKVKGVVGFEFGSSKFGGKGADFGGDDNVFELRWAYTDIELPFDPASRLTVGLQPVGYNALLWSDNAGGVKWTRKTGNWAYSLGWFRNDWIDSNSDNVADDKTEYNDAYAADLTYVFDNGNSLNAFVVYMDQGKETIGVTIGDTFIPTDEVQDEEIWLGLSGKGKWNELSGMFTGIYLTGEVSEGDYTSDRSAFLFHGQLDYTVAKNTFIIGGLYASGDEDPFDDDTENFDVIDIATSIFGSVIIFDNYCDDNSLSQAPYLFDQGYKMIYAGVDHKLNAKTKIWAKYFWHNTAEDTWLGDDEIGHEFVLGASYTIMKGLTADINAGYLIAGDAWKAIATDGDGDDVFRTDARIRFQF
ncbi:MAG: hypothetical protein AB7D06_14230 [Pedobacter sp.]